MTFERIAVIGAGAWGTALANVIARAGRSVTLAARDAQRRRDHCRERAKARGCPACGSTSACASSPRAAEAARHDAILLAVPAQHLRAAAVMIAPDACRGHAGDRLRQGHRARHAASS